MQYLLLIYTPEVPQDSIPPEDVRAEMDAYNAFTRELVESGSFKGGEALQPTQAATTVRVRDGRVLTTDGPFAETKEALGGYYMVEASDLDQAIEWAAKIPGATRGSIEVRPIWELPAEYVDPREATATVG